MIVLVITAVVDKVFYLAIPGINIVPAFIPWLRAAVHLGVNVVIILATVQILKAHKIKGIQLVGKPRPVAVAPEPPASVIS